MIREFVSPYNDNKGIFIGGKMIKPKDIEHVDIFFSKMRFDQIILPDGRKVGEVDALMLPAIFSIGNVKGVECKTRQFICRQAKN